MERKTSTDELNLQLNEVPIWDIGELPVLPPEFGEPPRLMFMEYLRFCDEMLRFNQRMGLNNQSRTAPSPIEFVM